MYDQSVPWALQRYRVLCYCKNRSINLIACLQMFFKVSSSEALPEDTVNYRRTRSRVISLMLILLCFAPTLLLFQIGLCLSCTVLYMNDPTSKYKQSNIPQSEALASFCGCVWAYMSIFPWEFYCNIIKSPLFQISVIKEGLAWCGRKVINIQFSQCHTPAWCSCCQLVHLSSCRE